MLFWRRDGRSCGSSLGIMKLNDLRWAITWPDWHSIATEEVAKPNLRPDTFTLLFSKWLCDLRRGLGFSFISLVCPNRCSVLVSDVLGIDGLFIPFLSEVHILKPNREWRKLLLKLSQQSPAEKAIGLAWAVEALGGLALPSGGWTREEWGFHPTRDGDMTQRGLCWPRGDSVPAGRQETVRAKGQLWIFAQVSVQIFCRLSHEMVWFLTT